MTTIHYEVSGEGQSDILLVHGWAASCRMWQSITTHLGEYGRYWSFDFPGFGKSPMPDTPPTVADHLATLITFIEAHALQPEVIIAHSMGGLITLKLAYLRPDLVKRLVLICPVVSGKFGLEGIASQILRYNLGKYAFRQTEQFWQLIQQEYLLGAVLTPWHVNPELAKRVREDFLRVNPRAGIEALVSLAHEDMTPYLHEIQHPTLVMVGAQDLTVPSSEGRTAALYMPNAELKIFPNSQHHPQDEETDAFIPVLRSFFRHHGIS